MSITLLAVWLASNPSVDATCACAIAFLSARDQRERYDLIGVVTVERADPPVVASQAGHPPWERQNVRLQIHASWKGPRDTTLTAVHNTFAARCGESPMRTGAEYLVYARRQRRIWTIEPCESISVAEAADAIRELGHPRWSDTRYAAMAPASPIARACPERDGELRLRLEDPTGGILPGASIRVSHVAGEQTLSTDAMGTARTCVPAGDVRLLAELPGMKSRRLKLRVDAGTIRPATLVLDVGPGIICIVSPVPDCESGPLPGGGYRWCGQDLERLPLQ